MYNTGQSEKGMAFGQPSACEVACSDAGSIFAKEKTMKRCLVESIHSASECHPIVVGNAPFDHN